MIPFFSSKIFRVFPQLCFRCSPRQGEEISQDGENCFALVLLFFVCDLVLLVISWCYRLSRFADLRRAVSSSQGVFAVLEKIPGPSSSLLLFQKHLRLILTILWFREKGGIGFVICINFFLRQTICNLPNTLDDCRR